jgi:vacuolar-type H+-ATPase subunit I/STV1
VIGAKDMLKFGKMIFRATKGHSILYTFNIPKDEIEENYPDLEIEARTAFIVIIESGEHVLNKVTRICESFLAKRYTLQTNKEAIFEKIKDIENAINDTKTLCSMTEKKLRSDLEVAVSTHDYHCSKYEAYKILIEKESLLYSTLNLLKVVEYEDKPGSTMIAKVWVPE